MHRVIKFRAWDEAKKNMIVVQGLNLGWKAPVVLENFGENWKDDVGQLPLMQFTGLLDKNGKEIYEGDKVSMTIKVNGEADRVSAGEVFWNKKKAAWSPNRMTFADTEVEIIGNIFENPGLLTTTHTEKEI